ncbi:hypothetical protein AGMMS49938_11550 [Fibrobacterales bacterium]|nr:hypothetical protein AGMMS49938_11550 [Fibrobacterales bacterium]
MAQSSLLQVRIDTNIKHEAERLFADIGLAWDNPNSLINHPFAAGKKFRKISREELYEKRIK